jgi:hypothetical protein
MRQSTTPIVTGQTQRYVRRLVSRAELFRKPPPSLSVIPAEGGRSSFLARAVGCALLPGIGHAIKPAPATKQRSEEMSAIVHRPAGGIARSARF